MVAGPHCHRHKLHLHRHRRHWTPGRRGGVTHYLLPTVYGIPSLLVGGRFQRFTTMPAIRHVSSDGVRIAIQCDHKDPLRPNLPCKKFVTITQHVDGPRARWLAKLWLLERCDPTIKSREVHVRDVRVHELDFFKFGRTEADLDAEAARRG